MRQWSAAADYFRAHAHLFSNFLFEINSSTGVLLEAVGRHTGAVARRHDRGRVVVDYGGYDRSGTGRGNCDPGRSNSCSQLPPKVPCPWVTVRLTSFGRLIGSVHLVSPTYVVSCGQPVRGRSSPPLPPRRGPAMTGFDRCTLSSSCGRRWTGIRAYMPRRLCHGNGHKINALWPFVETYDRCQRARSVSSRFDVCVCGRGTSPAAVLPLYVQYVSVGPPRCLNNVVRAARHGGGASAGSG